MRSGKENASTFPVFSQDMFCVRTYFCVNTAKLGRTYIGGQIRAHFFKSVLKSAKCAVGRKNAHFFDVLQTFVQTLCRLCADFF
jgi:hypothetical protein